MTKKLTGTFVIKAPDQRANIAVYYIQYIDFQEKEPVWKSRHRALDRVTGIETGGATEDEAYNNLVSFIFPKTPTPSPAPTPPIP